MDAIELLRDDQRSLKFLMTQALDSTEPHEKLYCIQELVSRIEVYQRAEQTVFYPSFNHEPGFAPLLEKATQLHRQLLKRTEAVQNLLRREEKSLLRAELSALNHVLCGLIEHDQVEIFPLAHRTLSRARRERLGRHLEAEKHDSGLGAA